MNQMNLFTGSTTSQRDGCIIILTRGFHQTYLRYPNLTYGNSHQSQYKQTYKLISLLMLICIVPPPFLWQNEKALIETQTLRAGCKGVG